MGPALPRTTWPRCRRCSAPAQVIEFVKKRATLDELVAGASSSSPPTRTRPMPRSTRRSSTRCARAEAPLGTTQLTEAVARYLFKLMAYKDEYEVARLHTDPAFLEQVDAQFEGDYKLVLPPRAAAASPRRNAKGELREAAVRPVDADRLPACWRS